MANIVKIYGAEVEKNHIFVLRHKNQKQSFMKPIMKNHLLCLLAAVGVVFLGGCKKSESSGKKSSLTFSQDQEFNLTF